MASAIDAATSTTDEHKKLILCFDGTGNTFSGTNADTNVVKILRKLDRNHPNQFHYYQTGIGTYDVNETSINKGKLGEFRSKISKSIDQGFGTTFDAHVMAGYRFLMRYYEDDAKIYIFGFSRGAYTAKYLARMVNKVGLLCKGNEEMVPFAYRLYQRSIQLESADRVAAQKQDQRNSGTQHNVFKDSYGHNGHASETARLLPNGTHDESQPHQHDEGMLAGPVKVEYSAETTAARKEIEAFGETFCRTAKSATPGKHANIQVFFLGIWDCVNSVKVVETKAPAPITVSGTAKHIRHAVAVDERRVKFKPALLAQDIRNCYHEDNKEDEDIREVWFPGNHGDIGGGWPALDRKDRDPSQMSWWKRFKYIWSTRKPSNLDKPLDDNALQMSDMALEWMIREVDRVGKKDPAAKVHWFDSSLNKFKDNMNKGPVQTDIIKGFMHDCLSFGYGTALFKVLMWKFMEIMPFVPRWELNDAENPLERGWEPYKFSPNGGAYRDIPRGAILHNSLKERLEKVKEYRPKNNHGSKKTGNKDQGEACLKVVDDKLVGVEGYKFENDVDKDKESLFEKDDWDVRHETWKLN
ncbi:hypothetical protein NM208_g7724 [Fusarium decemcellulare]|uniref:Uncharacterized protein n=1 Tax=Fusarium decemcellulare TaxID=57161 RepID=A0ACC1S7Y0_9HYPO|nr:hypothetical protein NM208_g7724 [Fusarium decemcellulare]